MRRLALFVRGRGGGVVDLFAGLLVGFGGLAALVWGGHGGCLFDWWLWVLGSGGGVLVGEVLGGVDGLRTI